MDIGKVAAHRAAAGETVLIIGQSIANAVDYFNVITRHLPDEIVRITRTHGNESITYDSGGRIKVASIPRGLGRVRGMDIDYLILDDHEPLFNADFIAAVFPAFGNKRPRISVIG